MPGPPFTDGSKGSDGSCNQTPGHAQEARQDGGWTVDNPEHAAVIFYKHPSRTRLRNRRAQARYREKRKGKNAEQEKMLQGVETVQAEVERLLADIEQSRASLEAERADFAAQKQAWQAHMQTDQALQQPARWLSPDLSALALRSDDTYQVAIRKAGMSEAFLDVSFAIACFVHRTCDWPLPTRDDINHYRLDRLFERKAQHQLAIERLTDADGSAAAHAQLDEYAALVAGVTKTLGWTSMTGGNAMARIMDTEFTQAGVRQYGLPPARHWRQAAARLRLSRGQCRAMLQLRDRWLSRRHAARLQIASLPIQMQSYLQHQPGAASWSYPASASSRAGVDCQTQLQACLQEEHKAAAEFFHGVRNKVLTSYQAAMLLRAAWPYKLDLHAVSSAMLDLLPGDEASAHLQLPLALPTSLPTSLPSTSDQQSSPDGADSPGQGSPSSLPQAELCCSAQSVPQAAMQSLPAIHAATHAKTTPVRQLPQASSIYAGQSQLHDDDSGTREHLAHALGQHQAPQHQLTVAEEQLHNPQAQVSYHVRSSTPQSTSTLPALPSTSHMQVRSSQTLEPQAQPMQAMPQDTQPLFVQLPSEMHDAQPRMRAMWQPASLVHRASSQHMGHLGQPAIQPEQVAGRLQVRAQPEPLFEEATEVQQLQSSQPVSPIHETLFQQVDSNSLALQPTWAGQTMPHAVNDMSAVTEADFFEGLRSWSHNNAIASTWLEHLTNET